MTIKEILIELKAINALDYSETDDHFWDGGLSYNGVKRLLFGLFNNGFNERGDNLTDYMSVNAAAQYLALSDKLKGLNQSCPILVFEPYEATTNQ